MTDWIEHTTDTCPVDPETVVEVQIRSVGGVPYPSTAGWVPWHTVDKYRLLTPEAAAKLTFAKPPEPEGKEIDPRGTQMWTEKLVDGRIVRCRVTAVGPNGAVPPTDDAPEVTFKSDLFKDPEPEMAEPDLITLRLECMKMAVSHFSILDREQAADRLLHYVLNGSVDKAP